MLCGCGRYLVVLSRRDEIFRAGVEDDVGWEGQVADRVVLYIVSKAALVVLGVGR